jgi:predicted ATPase
MSGWIPSPRCRRGCADWNSDWVLLAAAGTASEADAAIQQGLDVARRQNATSWELRCATSLARLWRQQGRHEDALALLAPVYRWFTEGFDTEDLKEAKALLNELT